MRKLISEVALEELLDTSIASEGYNWDTRRAIDDNPKLKILKQHLKDEKAMVKSAKKLKKSNPEAAVETYKKCIEMCEKAIQIASEVKVEIDQLREPDTFMEKILSRLTPVFSLWKFPVEEFDHVSVTPGVAMGYDGSAAPTINVSVQNRRYRDELSDSTKSAIKKQMQLAMNLFIKRASTEIASLKREIQQLNYTIKNRG